MKRIIPVLSIFSVLLLASSGAQAQTNPHAIGVRFGGGDGVGGEISYQQATFPNNRLEFDLGFTDAGWYNGFKFSLLYQWVFPISGGLKWYVGAGGSIGGWSIDDDKPGHDDFHDEGFFLDADGQIGLEYNCNIPLQFSIDIRPEFGLINDDFDVNSGLGIRYTF